MTALPAQKIEELVGGVTRYNDQNNVRWYENNGKKYISVTQVLDCFVPPQLKNWFKNNSAKAIDKKKT
jgi:hypothetical protein